MGNRPGDLFNTNASVCSQKQNQAGAHETFLSLISCLLKRLQLSMVEGEGAWLLAVTASIIRKRFNLGCMTPDKPQFYQRIVNQESSDYKYEVNPAKAIYFNTE